MRKLSWSAGLNALLVFDADLTDLGPYWDGMFELSHATRAIFNHTQADWQKMVKIGYHFICL